MPGIHAETEFEVISLGDGTFGVVVTQAGELPRTVTGFATQAEAETWTFLQLEKPDGNQGLPKHL
jgi:hypothetical protein